MQAKAWGIGYWLCGRSQPGGLLPNALSKTYRRVGHAGQGHILIVHDVLAAVTNRSVGKGWLPE